MIGGIVFSWEKNWGIYMLQVQLFSKAFLEHFISLSLFISNSEFGMSWSIFSKRKGNQLCYSVYPPTSLMKWRFVLSICFYEELWLLLTFIFFWSIITGTGTTSAAASSSSSEATDGLSRHQARLQAAANAASIYGKSFVYPSASNSVWYVIVFNDEYSYTNDSWFLTCINHDSILNIFFSS